MPLNKIVINALRSLAIALLIFNGMGALYGGSSLVAHPDGSGMQLSLSLLAHTPFHDYLIPGIILLVSNGLYSIMVLVTTIKRTQYYYLYIVSQGGILLGWLIIQVLLIRTIDVLHIIMGITSIGLILSGVMIRTTACMTRNTATGDHGQ